MTSRVLGNADDIDKEASASPAAVYLVPGLERGLNVLMQFSARDTVLSAAELSSRLKIPRSSVFRLLWTLELLGFVERADKDKSYRLGVSVLRLGFEYLSSLALTDHGLPILEGLRDATGLTCHILVRDGRDVVFVAKAQSKTSTFSSLKVSVGTRLPAHATTHGHVLLGDLTQAELAVLYPEAALSSHNKWTPRTRDDLYARIAEDAARGYAMSESSFESGISVVTAPVRGEAGEIVAVIAATVPRPEIDRILLDEGLIAKVCDAAAALSRAMRKDDAQDEGDKTSPAAVDALAPSPYLKALGLK